MRCKRAHCFVHRIDALIRVSVPRKPHDEFVGGNAKSKESIYSRVEVVDWRGRSGCRELNSAIFNLLENFTFAWSENLTLFIVRHHHHKVRSKGEAWVIVATKVDTARCPSNINGYLQGFQNQTTKEKNFTIPANQE